MTTFVLWGLIKKIILERYDTIPQQNLQLYLSQK